MHITPSYRRASLQGPPVQMLTAMLRQRAPDVPDSLPAWLAELLRLCLNFDANARPTVNNLHQVLQYVANIFSMPILSRLSLSDFTVPAFHLQIETSYTYQSTDVARLSAFWRSVLQVALASLSL